MNKVHNQRCDTFLNEYAINSSQRPFQKESLHEGYGYRRSGASCSCSPQCNALDYRILLTELLPERSPTHF